MLVVGVFPDVYFVVEENFQISSDPISVLDEGRGSTKMLTHSWVSFLHSSIARWSGGQQDNVKNHDITMSYFFNLVNK